MAATWSPTDKNASIALSGGDLTATGSAGPISGRGNTAIPTGAKVYWEVLISTLGANAGIGIANASASLSNFAGADNNAIGYFGSTNVFRNGGTVATLASFTSADRLRIAYDDTNKAIWWAVGGGNWNNSGAANPATNAGGISTSALAAGPYFPIMSLNNTTALTANFGATALVYPVPSGFTTLDYNALTASDLTTGPPILGTPALTWPVVGYVISIDDTKNWQILRARLNAIFADVDNRLTAGGL